MFFTSLFYFGSCYLLTYTSIYKGRRYNNCTITDVKDIKIALAHEGKNVMPHNRLRGPRTAHFLAFMRCRGLDPDSIY